MIMIYDWAELCANATIVNLGLRRERLVADGAFTVLFVVPRIELGTGDPVHRPDVAVQLAEPPPGSIWIFTEHPVMLYAPAAVTAERQPVVRLDLK